MSRLLILTLAGQLTAATYTVCPGGYPATCDYSDLQTAINALACGDELDIAPVTWTGNYFAGSNCSGNPVTVTSMRKTFLPGTSTRLSPAHSMNAVSGVTGSTGNIPILKTTTTAAALTVNLTTKGWHFVGLGFRAANTGSFSYMVINMEPTDLTDPDDTSDDVVFDRCFISGPENNNAEVNNGLLYLGTNLVVKNSTCKDVAASGFESHCFAGSDAIGPVTFQNNFVNAAGIPLFSGGNQPRMWSVAKPNYGNIPDGFTAKWNFFYKPHKWWPDPVNNPDAADFVSNGSKTFCTKNLGENKNAKNATWQYNVHQNQWSFDGNECEGQSFGFTFTPRAESGSWVIGAPVISPGNSAPIRSGVLALTGISGGPFQVGETITNVTSGKTGTCKEVGVSSIEVKNSNVYEPYGAPNWNAGDSISGGTSGATATIDTVTAYSSQAVSTTATSLVWDHYPTDGNGNPPQTGEFACVGGTFYTCRWITGVDMGTKTATVALDPGTGTGFPVAAGAWWIFGWDITEGATNVTVEHSVFRNVNKGMNFQAVEANPPLSPATPANSRVGAITVQNMLISHNLWMNVVKVNNQNGAWGFKIGNTEQPWEPATRTLPSGLTWDHNTVYIADALSPATWVQFPIAMGSWSGTDATPLDQFRFTNNILPPGQNALFLEASLGSSLSVGLASFSTTNANFSYNSFPNLSSPNTCTGGRTCTGNITSYTTMDSHFTNPAGGDFSIKPGDPFAAASSTGGPLGADVTQLPLINNLTVTPSANYITLAWDLTSVNNSVPVVIEVSTSRNLISDLGTYTVVNDVNPVLFTNPDYDTGRANGKQTPCTISSTHRSCQIGKNSTVTDDNGNAGVSLALTPNTLYYYRLQAGGDVAWGSTTTTNPVAAPVPFVFPLGSRMPGSSVLK